MTTEQKKRGSRDETKRSAKAARTAGLVSRGILLACVVAIVFTAAAFTRFVLEVARLENPATLEAADGIVVLTGDNQRIATALELLETGKGERLLISGVYRGTTADAIRSAVAGSSELFDCCVDIDKAALDTVGNAEETAAWARANGFVSLIVVTSDYHMPRSLIELRRKAKDVELRPYLVKTGATDGDGPFSDPETLRRLVPEFAKYIAARIRLGIREASTRTSIASAISD